MMTACPWCGHDLATEHVGADCAVCPCDGTDSLSAMTTARARLEEAGRAHARAREELARAREELDAAVLASLAEGLPESQAARLAGLDRMTVRKIAGKR